MPRTGAMPQFDTSTIVPASSGKQAVLVMTAPVGMAGPAAPQPVVMVVDPAARTIELPGRVPVKQGYVNEQQAAWQGAAVGAGQGAAIGALVGVIAGGVLGFIFGFPFGAIPGAISGAITGAVWGAVGGAVSGYINGQNQARAHNDAVRKNGGKPVAARVSVRPRAAAPHTAAAPMPSPALRKVPKVTAPPHVNRAIDDAKRAFARAFGIPVPPR
ncbi:hypothetical protein nbrc107697_03510 [Gordonia crocea]|uniref:Glycine zipper domain-containing protein n=2 Tax=Gordonia crocea TaxID=589162 RepID=A0A7M3SUI8_9ACTN|nr:hypothetical protein nbrc107697_03510 [Gordonia crocea]